MTLFDSHAHFTGAIAAAGASPRFDAAAIAAQLERAKAAGVRGVLSCGGGVELDGGAIAAARAAPGFALLALGIGRDDAAEAAATPSALRASLAAFRARIAKLESEGARLSAIGEIGLDFSRDPSSGEKDAQMALFAAQLDLSAELELPCTIHCRDAWDEMLQILAASGIGRRAAARESVLHCFTGSADSAAALLELGFCFGISGIATFNNAAALRAIVSTLPRGKALLETDSPWLAPVPLRGRTNEPAWIAHICALVASLWGVAAEECAAITTANAARVFNFNVANAKN